MLFHEIARLAVDEDERWLHRGDVQLGAAEIRMRLDPAVGDGERAPVRHEKQFVRVHAVRGKLPDPPETIRRVIDADHPRCRVEIVLRRVEQPAVRRKNSVAEEVPAGSAGDGHGFGAAGMVEHDRECARPPREGDGAAGDGIEGHIVASVRKVEAVQDLAAFRENRDAVALVAIDEGGGEHRVGGKGGHSRFRREAREEPGTSGLEEEAAVDQPVLRRAHGQSPSSEEKPAVSPNSPLSCRPIRSDRPEVTMRT